MSMRLVAALIAMPLFLTDVIAGTAPAGLVGTWQLVSRETRDAAGQVIAEPSLGSDPLGYIMYDAQGHIAVQLMARNRPTDACATTAEADTNNIAHIGGYDAYFGRYQVDQTAGTVTHTLEGAIGQGDVGRRMTRRFKIEGDTLTLSFEPGGEHNRGVTRTLIWRRVG